MPTTQHRPVAGRRTRLTISNLRAVPDLQRLLEWAGQHPFLAFLPFPLHLDSIDLSLTNGPWHGIARLDVARGEWDWCKVVGHHGGRLRRQHGDIQRELRPLKAALRRDRKGELQKQLRARLIFRSEARGRGRDRTYTKPSPVRLFDYREIEQSNRERLTWLPRLFGRAENSPDPGTDFVTFEGVPIEYFDRFVTGEFSPGDLSLRMLTVREGLKFDLAAQADDKALYIRSLLWPPKRQRRSGRSI